MTANVWTACGLCGDRVAYIGSHVIGRHLPYAPGQDAIIARLRDELIARTARDGAPQRYASTAEPYQSPATRRALAGELPAKEYGR